MAVVYGIMDLSVCVDDTQKKQICLSEPATRLLLLRKAVKPTDETPSPDEGMGIKTRKMLTEFIESLAEEQRYKTPAPIVKSSILSNDDEDESYYNLESSTDRRIRALWENLKTQLSNDSDSNAQPAEVPLPKPKEEMGQTSPATPAAPPGGSLEQFSTPALGRRLGKNTKKQVKSIIHNLAKNWNRTPGKIIEPEAEAENDSPSPRKSKSGALSSGLQNIN